MKYFLKILTLVVVVALVQSCTDNTENLVENNETYSINKGDIRSPGSVGADDPDNSED